MKQKTTLRLILIFIGLTLFLAACGGEEDVEPTPILPPANISVGGEDGNSEGVVESGELPVAADPVNTPTSAASQHRRLAVTATAEPTVPPTPITNPASLQVVTSGSMPPSSRDLLFLADGAFKRWNHGTQSVETLVPGADPASRIRTDENRFDDFVGDITDYSVSKDGKRAVFARLTYSQPITRTGTANGESFEFPDIDQQHELYFMDLVSRETWLIVPRVDQLGNFALSQDAQHVAFAGASLNGAINFNEAARPIFNMYFLPTGGGNAGAVKSVAQCKDFCSQIAWHPDNNLFTFSDNTALWLQNLAADAPEVLIENRPFFAATQDLGDIAVYSPIAWANNGRFLLMWKGGWEGGNRAVFDVPTRALQDVPNTFSYAELFSTEVMWMPDDRLYVLRSQGDASIVPQIELWRFQPEQNSVVKEESLVLSDQPVGARGQQYLDNGRFAYVLMNFEGQHTASGIYHLTSLNEQPERVNDASPLGYGAYALWPTDGSGVIIAAQNNGGSQQIYYGPAGGTNLFDVTAMMGTELSHFQWQPEIILP